MGGLLYKDFISVNRIGKLRLIWVISIYMLTFIILRIAFSGTRELQDFIITNEEGNVLNLLDVFFLMFYVFFIIFTMSFLVVSKIMNNDEKKKIRNYFDSMPIGKNTYVASKYIFIGISAYVSMAVDYIIGVTCAAFSREGFIQDLTATINSFLLNYIFIMLLLAAIELPLYIAVGKEITMRVMVVFWTVIAVIVIAFLMFGDLTIVSNWNIKSFLDFIDNHKSGVLIFQAFQPIIILGMYFLSYLISCHLYHRKEK